MTKSVDWWQRGEADAGRTETRAGWLEPHHHQCGTTSRRKSLGSARLNCTSAVTSSVRQEDQKSYWTILREIR